MLSNGGVSIENFCNWNSRIHRLAPANKLLERGDEVVEVDTINDHYDVNLKYGRLSVLASAVSPYPIFQEETIPDKLTSLKQKYIKIEEVIK